jgi:hypothetical protein
LATLTNCGDSLKTLTPSNTGNGIVAELIATGMVKALKYATMGNPQPSPKSLLIDMDAVQRLNVGGPGNGLRYSLIFY